MERSSIRWAILLTAVLYLVLFLGLAAVRFEVPVVTPRGTSSELSVILLPASSDSSGRPAGGDTPAVPAETAAHGSPGVGPKTVARAAPAGGDTRGSPTAGANVGPSGAPATHSTGSSASLAVEPEGRAAPPGGGANGLPDVGPKTAARAAPVAGGSHDRPTTGVKGEPSRAPVDDSAHRPPAAMAGAELPATATAREIPAPQGRGRPAGGESGGGVSSAGGAEMNGGRTGSEAVGRTRTRISSAHEGLLHDGTASGVGEVLAEIRGKLEEAGRYPAAARRRDIQGTVTVVASIDRRGALTSSRIVRSSGSSLLDEAAVRLLRRVFPVANLVDRPLTVEIPVSYRLSAH